MYNKFTLLLFCVIILVAISLAGVITTANSGVQAPDEQPDSKIGSHDKKQRRPLPDDSKKRKYIIKDLVAHPRSRMEAIIIATAESLLDCELPTVIYKGFELDGYCEKHKLAIEVQGPQHYKYLRRDDTLAEYRQRVISDVNKRKMCADEGIKFIAVYPLERINYRRYLQSRLYDIGLLADRPPEYVPAFEPMPEVPVA